MATNNKLTRTVGLVQKLPKSLQTTALSFLMGKVIPFAGTSGTRVEKLTPNECVIVMRNKKKVQNHIGSVHAAAMGLLAESATGFMTGMTVPDDRIIVIRSMELEYQKRASGDMKAVASFSDEQIQFIKDNPKGDISVPVVITDANGTETVKATMVWAWTPKKK